jgi:hypothetical protein
MNAAGSVRAAQTGFGLLYALLIVLAVGASVAIGMLLLRAPTPAAQVQNQEETLAWADQAVSAFAAAHSRLPCPAASADGEEDCGNGHAKGWLPLRTLVGASGPGQTLGPLRYMVYRGGDDATDLARASDHYIPQDAEGESREFDAAHINGLDLCRKLSSAARAGYSASAAHVADTAGTPYNVAYGIASAGPMPGDAGRFDGSNQDDTPSMESPSRDWSSGYDDRVRVRAFGALAQTQDCAFPLDWTAGSTDTGSDPDSSAIAAMDTLSNAVAVAEAAKDAQDDNASGTEISLGFAISAEVFDGVSVALAGVALTSSITTVAMASSLLASAITTCAVSLGLSPSCALIPIYTSAVAVGITAIALSGVALGLSAGALVGTTAALGLTIQAYDMAHREPASPDLVDISGAADAACTAAKDLQDLADDDAQAADDARQTADALESELDGWKQNPSDKIDYDSYNQYDAEGNLVHSLSDEEKAALHAQLQAKLEAIYAEEEAYQAYSLATSAADSAEGTYNNTLDSIAYLQNTTIPRACDTSATDYTASKCQAARDSLGALRDCDKDTDNDGIDDIDVQCAPGLYNQWQSQLGDANTLQATWQAALDSAQALPAPNMINYIPGCPPLGVGYCSALLVPGQDESDTRRTYARIVVLSLQAQSNASSLAQQAADSAQQAQDAAQNCQDLRNLQLDTGDGGTYVERWDGAAAIIEAADARGTVGEDIAQ